MVAPTQTDLNYWVSVATIIQALVVILAIGFTLRQLGQAEAARNLQSLSTTFTELHVTSEHKRRQRVIRRSGIPLEDIGRKGLEDARITTEMFQRVGFLVDNGMLNRTLVLKMYSRLILDLWDSLSPFVDAQRSQLRAPGYARAFERLAFRAERRRWWILREVRTRFAISGKRLD